MTIHAGFELLKSATITELKTEAKFYRHVRTGAEVLSLVNDDENKVFGIAFRTPPEDSTGVAHILEHSVLCGSRKFPVKEPFVELLKGSLKTFLNAFTYPDKTCYPVASQNVKDFYNLVDVYLDAVFYPLITPYTLQQEGWHFELESPDAPLTYKGVVYNEMKGAYSSPDSILAESSQQSLFPDTPYGLDSGGHPKIIPNLTYEQFKSFHDKFYHPSNARIYFYGDDDPDERLRILSRYLDGFDRSEVDSRIPLQRPFERAKRIRRPFASGKPGDEGRGSKPKGMITVNWLLPETVDGELNLALQVLEHVLIGMPGSPLRKALIDSGLGDDLAGTGLENELRQSYFSTGLKGIDVDEADGIEDLILKTLETLSKEGIDPETVEAALNTIEFQLRENNAGSYPRGLIQMLRALSTWLYEGDPLALLAFETPLSAVKSRAAADNSYFGHLIDRFFLKNPHRTTVVLVPDPDLGIKEEAEERERLESIRKAMSLEMLQAAVADARELRRRQQTPDSPEALSTIPTLKISDLDKENKKIPSDVLTWNGSNILFHDIFTNGIIYLDLGFDLHTLPQDYLPYASLFGRALVEIGTKTEDFVSLTRRISRKTGGIRPDLLTSAVKDSGSGAVWLILRAKSMVSQAEDLLSILGDVLLNIHLDNRERFKQMVLEEKARQEQRLVPMGHQMVNLRLRSHFGEADWASEQMMGVSYLMFLRKLANTIDEDWAGVLSILESVRTHLVNRRSMLFNVTLDQPGFSRFKNGLEAFIDSLPAADAVRAEWLPQPPPEFEGLLIPAQVNYVGKGFDLYRLGYKFNGSVQVISGYLRNSWLWDRVRVQGGAYGAFCVLDRISGVFTFVSYRDPNVGKTLETFDLTSDFLRRSSLSEEELTKAIIGAIGNLDAYLLPDAKGYMSMLRYLSHDKDEDRQQMRDEVLMTSTREFSAFAEVLDALKDRGLVKVLGPKSAIDESISTRGDWLKLLQVL